jgi:60 kDa SS-A/Ro ribonucleoprotein
LDRFLVLGTDGGTFYAGEKKLTVESAAVVRRLIKGNGVSVVDHIVNVSVSGRAAKNDPALLALAICAKEGDLETRRAAFAALPKVARIGTHLFHFADFIKVLGGGWGRGTANAFAAWYEEMPVEKLAMQAVKYQQRDGWSHRDILRKSHPKTNDDVRKTVFDWMCRGWESVGRAEHPVEALQPIWAFERAKKADRKELIKLIADYGLPHECVPNEAKSDPKVWSAMLPHMGLTAMVRNLGKMTSVGVLDAYSAEAKLVRAALEDEARIKKERLHPVQILNALKVYNQGHGDKGSLSWKANQKIVDCLDSAFYRSFQAIEPTGKNHLLAVDVSGSMGFTQTTATALSCREAAAAMCLVTANVEPETEIFGFGTTFHPLAITPNMRLDAVVRYMDGLPFSGTDCSLPMVHATAKKLPIDAFCVYTDNETFAGRIHPHKALQEFRQKSGRPAKLAVFGMAVNGFTIADPNDSGMMDVVGFDTAAPAAVADFFRD